MIRRAVVLVALALVLAATVLPATEAHPVGTPPDRRVLVLEAGRRDGPVTHDRQAPVATHLADERADLAGADVDADEDRFSFHRVVRLRSGSASRGSDAG